MGNIGNVAVNDLVKYGLLYIYDEVHVLCKAVLPSDYEIVLMYICMRF